MPDEVIQRINALGEGQGMPRSLTFGDRHGRLIPDTLDNIEDDSTAYSPTPSVDDDHLSYNSDESDDDPDDPPAPFFDPPAVTGADTNDEYLSQDHDIHNPVAGAFDYDYNQPPPHRRVRFNHDLQSEEHHHADDFTRDSESLPGGVPLDFQLESPSPLRSPSMASDSMPTRESEQPKITGADLSPQPSPSLTGAGEIDPPSTSLNGDPSDSADSAAQ